MKATIFFFAGDLEFNTHMYIKLFNPKILDNARRIKNKKEKGR